MRSGGLTKPDWWTCFINNASKTIKMAQKGTRIAWCNGFYYSNFILYEFRFSDWLISTTWCNSRGVNSIHHCLYTMASADSKFDDFCLQCIQFE